jgi:cytochrome c oxidase assembly protein subunit 15
MSHAMLAQLFFLLTILLAYAHSREWHTREKEDFTYDPKFFKAACVVMLLIYGQLLLGAWMRHTRSGLAIPDFPLAAGYILPDFGAPMLQKVNAWRHQIEESYQDPGWLYARRLDQDFTVSQMVIHFIHRIGALLVTIAIVSISYLAFHGLHHNKRIVVTILFLNFFLILQWVLAAYTIWSLKHPYITSLHVVNGAAILGLSMLLVLRIYPMTREEKT